MDYSFKVVECEEKMKNYFRNKTGRLIRDSLIITIKNNGKRPWAKYKGYFKCLEEKSNIYFETFQIPKDILENETIEFVLFFPRIKKNFNSGKMLSTIQFVYKDTIYNDETIQFIKTFDITGNTVIRIRKEKEAERRKKEEEEKRLREEELKKYYLDKGEEIVEVEGGFDKMSFAIKKFRNIFNLPEEKYDDNYIKQLIVKYDYDFNYAFNIHLDLFKHQSSESEESLDDENKLNDLKHKLRDSFLLPEEDFNDKEIEEALKESKGDIYRSFARLMSISE